MQKTRYSCTLVRQMYKSFAIFSHNRSLSLINTPQKTQKILPSARTEVSVKTHNMNSIYSHKLRDNWFVIKYFYRLQTCKGSDTYKNIHQYKHKSAILIQLNNQEMKSSQTNHLPLSSSVLFEIIKLSSVLRIRSESDICNASAIL